MSTTATGSNPSLGSMQSTGSGVVLPDEETLAEQQRQCFSHSATTIVANTARNIVNQVVWMMNPHALSTNLAQTHVEHLHMPPKLPSDSLLKYTTADISFLVRSVASIYLHGLSL